MASMLAALLLTACSDNLLSDLTGGTPDGQEGIPFTVSTVEIGDEAAATTRAAEAGKSAYAGTAGATAFAMHPLEGDNPSGLKVYAQPLPLIGIHPGAVKACSHAAVGEPAILSQAQQQTGGGSEAFTRAAANEVVATSGINFHDSLTIWGYTSNDTELFDQILLTKVRNWRNSVEWPYGQGDYMKFYAVAPSLETINMSDQGTASYSTPPTLTYTLPEKADELLDVLYGESDNISIASGPSGSVTTNPKVENLGKDNKYVDLRFRHITTAVRFSKGTVPDNITINSISLRNVYSKATYRPANNDASTGTAGTWESHEGSRSYTIESKTISGTENVYIDGGKVLFMLPQTLPADATLQVTLTEDKGEGVTKDHTISCIITDDVWKKGYTMNYKITVGELEEGYSLTAEATKDIEHSDLAVSGSLDVHSYHLYSDYSTGGKIDAYRPVTWDVVGFCTDSVAGTPATWTTTQPTWLTDFRGIFTSDNHYEGGQNTAAYYTVAAQEYERNTQHDVVLYDNPRTDASAWDLSKKNPDGTAKTTTETANCYIVNRTGSYTFPLVYGNMSEDNSDQNACFKDHSGNTITKYKIKEQIGAKADGETHSATEYWWSGTNYKEKNLEACLRAVLLWQDVDGLVTSPTVSTTYNNIGFTVSQSTPGNAVLALQARKVTYDAVGYANLTSTSVNTYGDWETLWTWHIWMTDEVYKNDGLENEQSYDTYYLNGTTSGSGDHIPTITNWGGTSAQILPVNLGWVPDEMDFGLYKPRTVWVKIKQTSGNADPAIIQITQHARQRLYTGTGTCYQWGRPTALPSVRTVDGTLRKIYDIDGNDISSSFILAEVASAGDAIKEPFKILRYSTAQQDSWFNIGGTEYDNAMWNSSTKTVYDPCPPGFRVPPVSIFTGFSKTGGTVQATAGQLNMWPETQDANGITQKSGERSKGGYFYCTPNETKRYGNMVYMPATGEFHGNKDPNTPLSNYQLNNINGIFWTSDYLKDATSKACFLWITPEQSFSAGTSDKPVIGFFDTSNKKNYYGSVRQIRPMKIGN